MLILDKIGFFLFSEDWWFYFFLSFLVLEVPYEDTLVSDSPQFIAVEADIVDIFSVTDVDLMGFSHEGVVPNLDEGVVSDAEEEVILEHEVDAVEFVAVEGLHFDLDGHFDGVVSSDGGVFEDDP